MLSTITVWFGSQLAKRLVERVALPGDARRARVALSAAGRQLYHELIPPIAANNAQLVAAPDDRAVQALDAALTRLTEAALRLNPELARAVSADRRAGGSRRFQPLVDDALARRSGASMPQPARWRCAGRAVSAERDPGQRRAHGHSADGGIL